MGTHPIFESDFDCLTVLKQNDRHGVAATTINGNETRQS